MDIVVQDKKIAKLLLIVSTKPRICIEILAHLVVDNETKLKLETMGFHWNRSSPQGVLNALLPHYPKKVFATSRSIKSSAQMKNWISKQQEFLHALGYQIEDTLTPADINFLSEHLKESQV